MQPKGVTDPLYDYFNSFINTTKLKLVISKNLNLFEDARKGHPKKARLEQKAACSRWFVPVVIVLTFDAAWKPLSKPRTYVL